jgi:hypothetical protein
VWDLLLPTPSGMTPLGLACCGAADVALVRFLHSTRADVRAGSLDRSSDIQTTALVFAVQRQRADIVAFLLSTGEINTIDGILIKSVVDALFPPCHHRVPIEPIGPSVGEFTGPRLECYIDGNERMELRPERFSGRSHYSSHGGFGRTNARPYDGESLSTTIDGLRDGGGLPRSYHGGQRWELPTVAGSLRVFDLQQPLGEVWGGAEGRTALLQIARLLLSHGADELKFCSQVAIRMVEQQGRGDDASRERLGRALERAGLDFRMLWLATGDGDMAVLSTDDDLWSELDVEARELSFEECRWLEFEAETATEQERLAVCDMRAFANHGELEEAAEEADVEHGESEAEESEANEEAESGNGSEASEDLTEDVRTLLASLE